MMAFHRYVVFDTRNTEEALTVFYRLSFVSSVLATAAAAATHYLAGLYPALAIGFTPPATYVIYRILAGLTTDRFWSTAPGRWLGVHTRDIAGSWHADIQKKHLDGSVSTDTGTFCIEQNWRMLSLTLSTGLTRSSSTSASLIMDGGMLRVEYQYYAKKNDPHGGVFEDHFGSATLTITMRDGCADLELMDLSYFTNHGEAGRIALRRK
jgi:hypothetical protein